LQCFATTGAHSWKNLIAERHKSITEQIEDWRFLAAFGITRLGTQ
jgi:hypothetical protein